MQGMMNAIERQHQDVESLLISIEQREATRLRGLSSKGGSGQRICEDWRRGFGNGEDGARRRDA
jgi:hypothetical protein